MRTLSVFATAAVGFASTVLGHGYVNEAIINGITYTGYQPYQDPYMNPIPARIFRKIAGNGPIEDLSLIDLQCGGFQGSGSAPALLTAPATAGSTVTLKWTPWPDSHHGPTITYMARCPASCDNYNPGTDAVWFKVAHEGLRSDGTTWATDDLITSIPYNFTIPQSLQDGEYIVRHELLALHSAYSYPGPQFYPSCFQITLTGGGSSTGPAEKVAFPGEYTPTTPGVVFDIYKGNTNYPIPGPAVWNQ
ncbi:glycoside hydrolase [Ascodesmis nigricans]|uniref:lytic cellulose monooxygenase (C4-dehydrogenating) n=1 Tax=Ascodesmis nigricans TaxID=341454 RepID=A0A4S2MYL0_9PEZI|nr:glycoside hydrolase [Ascodesmis nigricans]